MDCLASWLIAQTIKTDEFSLDLRHVIADVTASKLVRAAIGVAIAYLIILALGSLFDQVSEQVPRRFRLVIKQAVPFLKALVLVLVAAYLIHLFVRLSGTNLLALTGTVALTLGFVFKDYFSSVLAGIITLFEGPYRVGDRVKIGDTYGEVVHYGLREMRIKTPDDSTVTIPHNIVWTEALTNMNSGHLEAQTVTDFYFDPRVNIETVMEILYQAAYSSRYTQLRRPPVVTLEEQPKATHFSLKAYAMDARDEFAYKTDLTFRAKQAFARQDIAYRNNLD